MKQLKLSPALALNIALFALFWLLIFNRLHTEWVVNTLYSYGWAVPFLTLYLLMERWRDRPAPAANRPHPLWLIIPAALLLAYIPVRVINEANPDWVKINFYMTTLGTALCAAALFAMGRFRYLWHFGFPIFFIYTALPWPVWMEDTLVQTLTRWNTMVSAESLTLCGFPAIAQGNLIHIGGVWVNVEEACSGIRSLQTAFMMSLFLGEFYRLGPILRVLLMGSSFVVAFGLNIGRTFTLTYISGTQGNAAMEKWHDTLGTAVMFLCLAALWLLAMLFEKIKLKLASERARKPPADTTAATAPVPLPFPNAFLVFGLICLLTAEITTESWYRYHEARLAPPKQWGVTWPAGAPSFKQNEFPDRTKAILKYNSAETASWLTAEGYNWGMYYIQWLPGRVSKFLSSSHYPTVCLPATGLKFVAETGQYLCRNEVLDIPFTTYLFQAGDKQVYVFHAIIEERPPDKNGEKLFYHQVNSGERIDSVLLGHRNLGQRVLGISITGPSSLEEAEASLQKVLQQIITSAPIAAKP